MSEDLKWMKMAVDEGKKSIVENRNDPAPKVGAVLVKEGQLIATAYRGMLNPGDHAEYCLLESLKGKDLKGATLYTTLEPCSRRSPSKTPCANRIVDRGISEVVIGIYDPNPKIHREGWKLLRDAGVKLRDFPKNLRAEVESDNIKFTDIYKFSIPDQQNRGTFRFDYTLGEHKFKIRCNGSEIVTQWSKAGKGVIHAISNSDYVVLARHANEFNEIDDPSALWAFSNYTVTVNEGEIVIFKNRNGVHALIKIIKVLAGPDRGDDRFELEANYELRYPT